MSLECRECERDLRGGHDPSCSRYRNPRCKCGHGLYDHDIEGPCMSRPTKAWECTCRSFYEQEGNNE